MFSNFNASQGRLLLAVALILVSILVFSINVKFTQISHSDRISNLETGTKIQIEMYYNLQSLFHENDWDWIVCDNLPQN